jgi:hypothetical protein
MDTLSHDVVVIAVVGYMHKLQCGLIKRYDCFVQNTQRTGGSVIYMECEIKDEIEICLLQILSIIDW